ncbi:MAG: hypothetical protein KBT11_04355, partial [Treponema sp.]|nr:hypothetical protein [Candidatus Treponema equifaecale]
GWENDSSSAYVGELTAKDTELLAENSKNELYGVNLTGTTSGSTFTASSDISSYKFIRKGGLIKLSGVYYVISDVSGNAITVVENLTTSPTSAFVAAAMILDHVSTAETPLWSGNVCTIAGDEDGDGFIEYIKKSGATWTLQADIFSDLLEDGPVTLVTMAFDKAENVTTTTTDLMIANNAPRLAKVYLATDLNGDTKFTDNELGSSLIKNENTTQKFYSALTNGTEGNVQEVVTISANNDGVNTGITMRDTLGVAFEWVSGYEGYGSGNGDIYYKLGISNAAIDKPASGTTAPIADMSSSFDTTVGSVTASVSTAKLKGLTVTPATVKATSYTEYVSEKEATASNPKNEAVNFINLTLWDSTKGTTAGTGDTVSGDKITKFGSQYTVLNIPLYMDLVDGAKPTPKFSSLEAESATTGHVDLSDTLPSTYFKDTNTGLFDRDSKASGKVVFTGTVNDEKRITELNLKTSKTFANGFTTANSNVKVAEFKDGSLVATTAATSNSASWKFEITKEQFTTAEGHTVNWKLTVDTSKVAGIANSDVKFTITANDGTNNESAEYQVDVVPYITKVSSSKAYYRTMFGNYSVFKGDTLTVKGYNLGNPAVSEVYVGENQKVTPNGGGDDYFTFVVPEYSGSLFVNVSGVRSLNDMNNNKELSNREAKSDDENATTDGGVDYYDERYIYVWDKNHQFKSADDNAHKPVMTSDYDGNLFAAWTLMGAGQQQIERKLTNDSIRVMQHYDQPNEFSAIGIDKTKSGGAISSLVINENVGDGGVMTNNGFSHVSNCGGAFGISIDNAVTVNQNDTSANADKKSPKIANNPFTILDSNWSTSGYSLSSYAMLRDSGKFSTPRTARYGDNMHYVYYNSKNQSLRYTYVKSGSSTATYVRNGNLTTESWIILDGNNSGYDRFHDFVNTTGNLDLVGVAPSSSTANSVTIRAANWSGKIKTGADISVAMAYTYNNINKVVCYDVTGVTWNGNNVTLRFSETYELGTSKPDSVTVYTGAKSLASGTGSATQSSNAGKFASLDLTSTGIPVVAYYDGKNSRLRISYANSATPTETANWVRKDVMYKAKTTDATATQYARGGSHCSLKVDKDGNIHILYRDNKNQLAYIKGTGSVTTGFEFSIPEVIDDNTTGTYGTLSLINGSQPAVAYLNAEESETGIKYALRKEFKFEDDAASSVWDVMVVPVTEGYNPVGENLISCESNNGNWTATEDSVAMKDVTSVIGYQTTRMDVAFLKSEK